MKTFPFVDAHVHLWDLSHIHYPWLTPPFDEAKPAGSTEAIARSYGLDDYLADAANWDVRAIVHVDAGADPADALKETEWLEAMAASRGMPNAIIAFAALNDPDLEVVLAAHAAHPHVRGIRHIVGWHGDGARTYAPRDVTGDADWQAGFALLKKYGLSFDCQVYPSQFSNVASLIARHPGTQVIVNHLGMPIVTDPDGRAVWRAGLKQLSALPNVAIKLSGVGFIHRDWTEDSVRSWMLEAIDFFTPSRCLVASDFPTDKLFGSCDRHLSAYRNILSVFSEDEQRAMWGRNAARLYRLDIEV